MENHRQCDPPTPAAGGRDAVEDEDESNAVDAAFSVGEQRTRVAFPEVPPAAVSAAADGAVEATSEAAAAVPRVWPSFLEQHDHRAVHPPQPPPPQLQPYPHPHLPWEHGGRLPAAPYGFYPPPYAATAAPPSPAPDPAPSPQPPTLASPPQLQQPQVAPSPPTPDPAPQPKPPPSPSPPPQQQQAAQSPPTPENAPQHLAPPPPQQQKAAPSPPMPEPAPQPSPPSQHQAAPSSPTPEPAPQLSSTPQQQAAPSLAEPEPEPEPEPPQPPVVVAPPAPPPPPLLKGRRSRCLKCEACLREDCGVCVECVRKVKFGGDGSSKNACIHRRCTDLQVRPPMGRKKRRRGGAQQQSGGLSLSGSAAALKPAGGEGDEAPLRKCPKLVAVTVGGVSIVSADALDSVYDTSAANEGEAEGDDEESSSSSSSAEEDENDASERESDAKVGKVRSSGRRQGTRIKYAPKGDAQDVGHENEDEDEDEDANAGAGGGHRPPPPPLPPAIRSMMQDTSYVPYAFLPRTGNCETTDCHRRRRKHPPTPAPEMMYGRHVPLHNGQCGVCFGSKNHTAPAKRGPMLRCHGDGCSRVYHWSCYEQVASPLNVPLPELHAQAHGEDGDGYGDTPEMGGDDNNDDDYDEEDGWEEEVDVGGVEGDARRETEEERYRRSFMCEHCDPLGSTRALAKYFEMCNEERANHASSLDYVLHLLDKQMQQIDEAEGSGEESAPRGVSGRSNIGKGRKRRRPPTSEISRIEEFHNLSMEEVQSIGQHQSKQKSFSTKRTDGPEHHAGAKEETGQVIKERKRRFGAAFLVGKQVRLYCPLDNSYHVGRIVDWRRARNPLLSEAYLDAGGTASSASGEEHRPSTRARSHFYGEDEIARSEFLVRFRPGLAGRKQMLHEWIVLEEHSLAIGLSLIFGQLGKGKKGWKPAQTMVRSSLELIPVQDSTVESAVGDKDKEKESWALAMFFGDETHAMLRLCDEVVDFYSPSFASLRQHGAMGDSGSTSTSNRTLALAVSLAEIEFQEQRRILNWHRLPLMNPAHPRALSILDQDALPPLMLKRGHLDEGTGDDAPENDLRDNNVEHPKLCALVEQGLDRMWFMDIMGPSNLEWSMDSVESMTVSVVASPSMAMAQLMKAEREHATSVEPP